MCSRHERDALDLDLGAVDREARHLDERRGRTRVAEHLLAQGVDQRPVVDVREVDRHLDDVVEAAPAGREHRAHVLEHLTRLRDDVVSPDEPTLAVDRDDPGHVQEPAGAHGVREVRDRLGQLRDADLVAGHEAPRSSLSSTRGLMRSGSTTSSITAGLPDARERSNASSNCSVRSTRSPCAP